MLSSPTVHVGNHRLRPLPYVGSRPTLPQRKRARAPSHLFDFFNVAFFFPVDICRGHAKTPPGAFSNSGSPTPRPQRQGHEKRRNCGAEVGASEGRNEDDGDADGDHGGDDDGDGDGSGGGGGSGDGGDDLGDDEGHSVWRPMGAASRPRKAAQ